MNEWNTHIIRYEYVKRPPTSQVEGDLGITALFQVEVDKCHCIKKKKFNYNKTSKLQKTACKTSSYRGACAVTRFGSAHTFRRFLTCISY